MSEPFDELNETDRACAIDCVVACTVLAARIPACGKPLFDWLTTEFASQYGVPKNVIRYVLRHIGQTLYSTDWGFTATKKNEKLVTLFVPEGAQKKDGDADVILNN
jgi:hypothetical protein